MNQLDWDLIEYFFVYEILNDKISRYKDFDSFKELSNPLYFFVIWLLKKIVVKIKY
jgi:hypothetical protein